MKSGKDAEMSWRFAKTACIITLACCSGCASVAPPAKLGMPGFLKKNKTVSEEGAPSQAEPAPDHTPKRQPLIALNRDASAESQHDLETQRLIDRELADASPEERQKWEEYLATVDSKLVPYYLQSRRANSPERAEEAPSQALAADTGTPETIVPASFETRSETPGAHSLSLSDGQAESRTEESTPPESQVAHRDSELDWSGKLKSFAEWEKNPLNFSRGTPPQDEDSRKDRRSRPLPKIIASPFLKETPGGVATAPREQTPGRIENNLKTAAVTTPDNLRITPGAKLWEEELLKLVSLMEAEASAAGRSGAISRDELRQQVALRLLYLLNNQTEMAMQPIPGLQAADQEFWTALFWGLSEYLNQKGLDPAERSTNTIEKFRSATHYLQFAANLQLRNVSFCSNINGFGSYEPFEVNQFTPAQPVLIYCEIRNFQSEPTDVGDFVTKLRSSLEIYRGGLDGELVERNNFPATEDHCRTLRTDYYHSYRIDLPASLSPGNYTMRLTVSDSLSGKSTSEVLQFTIR